MNYKIEVRATSTSLFALSNALQDLSTAIFRMEEDVPVDEQEGDLFKEFRETGHIEMAIEDNGKTVINAEVWREDESATS